MNKREAEFLQRLRATFLVEAREHLQTIATSLLALERAGSMGERAQQVEIAFRHTHSLKGAARAAGFQRIEAVCQHVEEVFALAKRRDWVLPAADFDVLHRAFDLVGQHVDADGEAPAGASAEQAQRLMQELQVMAAGSRAVEAERERSEEPAATAPGISAGEERHAPAERTEGASMPAAADRPTVPASATDTVRVTAAQLDRILLAAEEMLMVKQASAERAGELRGIGHHLEEWGARWLAVQPALRRLRESVAHRPAETAAAEAPLKVLEFAEWSFGHVKALESRLRTLARAAARDDHAVGRQVDELLDESKQLLMMPFATLTAALPKLVRDLAREQGKRVRLDIDGEDVQLDKRILEQLKDPLVHLVRNAIDHGIEPDARRQAAGKAPEAVLRVCARVLHGNTVEIVVADDGVGIDAGRLRSAAINAGVVAADAARQLDDMQALDLAFRSDVSTSPIITEISGRGLGLAIVRENVERLAIRGRHAPAEPHGTAFTITLPQSLATLRGLFVQAGGQVFVLPATHVERVARFPRDAVRTVSGRETLSIDDAAVSLVPLHALLELPPAPAASTSTWITVAVIGTGAERLALEVEDIQHDDDVLVRRFEAPLRRVRNVAGATVLASGRVVPILNVGDLVKSARRVGDAPRSTSAALPDEAISRRVLVAEDSITSRLLIKGILEAAGCEVKTVVDGIEAFTALRSEPFDLLVSDIEMPRLNGFDLTARIRADRTLSDLPVVLVTALSRREDRERGIDVGANAYITKGGFDQRDLVDAVRRLVGTRVRA
jgi:two-component system chemotaxis sensor kinase CheA